MGEGPFGTRCVIYSSAITSSILQTIHACLSLPLYPNSVHTCARHERPCQKGTSHLFTALLHRSRRYSPQPVRVDQLDVNFRYTNPHSAAAPPVDFQCSGCGRGRSTTLTTHICHRTHHRSACIMSRGASVYVKEVNGYRYKVKRGIRCGICNEQVEKGTCHPDMRRLKTIACNIGVNQLDA